MNQQIANQTTTPKLNTYAKDCEDPKNFEGLRRTAWYSPAQVPDKIGLYETKFVGVSDNAPKMPRGYTEIHRWDGKTWFYMVKGREQPRWSQRTTWHWRGLKTPAP